MIGVGSTRRSRETLGGVLVGLASFLFGTVVILGKLALRHGVPVFSMLAIRFGIAAAVLAGTLMALRRPLAAAPGERLGLLILGLAGYAAESSFFFAAARHGTAAAVTLLFFTYPVFVTLATWVLGRGPSRRTVGSLAAAVVGAAVVVATGGGLSIEMAGVAFALGSALTYTAYLMGADRVLKRTDALTGATWVSASAALGLVMYAAVTGNGAAPAGWGEWGPILGMGIATAGAFASLLEGLKRLGAVRTSIISATEPFAAAVLGFVFLGEAVGLGTAIGGVLILAGAMAVAAARAAPPAEPPIP